MPPTTPETVSTVLPHIEKWPITIGFFLFLVLVGGLMYWLLFRFWPEWRDEQQRNRDHAEAILKRRGDEAAADIAAERTLAATTHQQVVDGIGSRVDSLAKDVAGIDEDVAEIARDVDGIAKSVADVATATRELHLRTAETHQRLDAVGRVVQAIAGKTGVGILVLVFVMAAAFGAGAMLVGKRAVDAWAGYDCSSVGGCTSPSWCCQNGVCCRRAVIEAAAADGGIPHSSLAVVMAEGAEL